MTENSNSHFAAGGAGALRGQTGRAALEPCPFCGAPGFLVGGVTAHEVKCTNTDCTARGREHPNRGEAIAAWNRRAPSADKAEPPEFDRDTDGELLIDWSPAQGRMVTLSLRDDGRLSYAFTWDGDKAHGTAQMPASLAVPSGCLAEHPVRMLTSGEIDAEYNVECLNSHEYARAMQRKFCEVNGLTIKEDKQ